MKRILTLACIIGAVMLTTLASANPFDIMKKAGQRQVYDVKDIPGGSSGNILPESYRKSFRLVAFQCKGLPNGYDLIRWNIDIDNIDESKGYTQFNGRSLQVMAESIDKFDAIVQQVYDITGSYKDGTLQILSAKPVHYLADKHEANLHLLKGMPGIRLIVTPSTGKRWQSEFLVDEYDDLSCEVSTYVAREPYPEDQWKKWIEKGTNFETQRAANAKIPTTLFGKIEIAKKNTRKYVEKVILNAGGKIISEAPIPGNHTVIYDISPIISDAEKAIAIYVPEDGKQIFAAMIIQIRPPSQAGQGFPAYRVNKMLTEKYGNSQNGEWIRDGGKTRITISIDSSAWTGYSDSQVMYSNVKYNEIADARNLKSKQDQQKSNKNAF